MTSPKSSHEHFIGVPRSLSKGFGADGHATCRIILIKKLWCSYRGIENERVTNQSEIVEQLKVNFLQWVTLDKREREAKRQIREINDAKKGLSETILKGLAAVDKTEICFTNQAGKLKSSETTVYAPIKKEHIFNTLRNELRDEDRARDLVEKLYDRAGREEDRKSEEDQIVLRHPADIFVSALSSWLIADSLRSLPVMLRFTTGGTFPRYTITC